MVEEGRRRVKDATTSCANMDNTAAVLGQCDISLIGVDDEVVFVEWTAGVVQGFARRCVMGTYTEFQGFIQYLHNPVQFIDPRFTMRRVPSFLEAIQTGITFDKPIESRYEIAQRDPTVPCSPYRTYVSVPSSDY